MNNQVMYALCASGAANTHVFVDLFMLLCRFPSTHSFMFHIIMYINDAL